MKANWLCEKLVEQKTIVIDGGVFAFTANINNSSEMDFIL